MLSKIIKTVLLCNLFVIKNAYSGTFSVENDTGVSCYKVYLPQKQMYVEDFRIRVTFHETAKDSVWLTEHRSQTNKIDLPPLYGTVSKLSDIQFPDQQSWQTKFITLYVTATCCNEQRSAILLNATTFELNEVTPINNIFVRFRSIDSTDRSLNVELNINNHEIVIDKSFIKRSHPVDGQQPPSNSKKKDTRSKIF